MATETPCQTPGAQYHTHIAGRRITCVVDLPTSLDYLSTADAELLDANLHNALELVLARYFTET